MMLVALLREAFTSFLANHGVSRGAAIAYYTVFSIAPILVIAISVAGLALGERTVEGAITDALDDMLGEPAARTIEGMIRNANSHGTGTLATILGIATLLLGAGAVFGELQNALNTIWDVPPRQNLRGAVARALRARAAGLGLVLTTGFLLVVSLVASTVLTAFATWADHVLPAAHHLLSLADGAVSFGFTTALFAAIYKLLPDRPLHWGDVGFGALLTAALFTLGKGVIGWYVGSSNFASTYGAAGALMVVLLWVYWSAQIFLFGAEVTRAWAARRGR
jgi:membrane protein